MSMASIERRADPTHGEGDWPPLSISSSNLLPDGTDQTFREMIRDLLHLEDQVTEARDRLAGEMGVSGPGYTMIMALARLQVTESGGAGVSVGTVARALRVSGPFVTAEVRKLIAAELVEKFPNPDDGRGVLLSLTLQGRERIQGVALLIRKVNDYFFGDLSATDFGRLAGIVGGLNRKSAQACFLLIQEAA